MSAPNSTITLHPEMHREIDDSLQTSRLTRSAMLSVVAVSSARSSSSQRRPRAIDATTVARFSERIGRACCGDIPSGRRIAILRSVSLRRAISPRQFCDQMSPSRATTLSRKDWHSGAIGAVLSVNFGRQGRPEILPRRLHRRGGASVVRRDAAKPNGGSRCQSLQRSDRRRQRQPPFQRQNHRDTARTILSRRGSIAARSNRASSACCNHPQAQRFGDGRNSTLTSIENQ
jgi:hypothetical protein